MNPGAEKIFDGITHIREELVEAAQDYRFRRRTAVWRYLGNLAACLGLVTVIGLAGLFLLLPRGCGASGGGSKADMDMAEPADRAPSADAPYGDVNQAPQTSEPAPALCLEARVTELGETELLAELLPGQDAPEEARILAVPLEGLAELPALRPGDAVRILCGGVDWTADPPRAADVTEIILID